MRFVILPMTAFCCQSFHGVAPAADDPPPASLPGFVKPGMHLGVRFSLQDSFVTLVIFNKDPFRFARARHVTGSSWTEVPKRRRRSFQITCGLQVVG